MSGKNPYKPPRDVRTLVLCKIHKNHQKGYSDISGLENKLKCWQGSQGAEVGLPDILDFHSYFTVGAYDATAIYKLDIGADSDGNGMRRDWLNLLLEDKKKVFQEMSSDISYYPVHIVANMDGADGESRRKSIEDFWRPETIQKLPFLIITMVYGTNRQSDGVEQFATGKEISYEDKLWAILKETRCEDEEHCKVAVYNGINLFDLVVLWRTDRISETLKKTICLRTTGVTRKTYHFINIPLEKCTESFGALQTEFSTRSNVKLSDKALACLQREEVDLKRRKKEKGVKGREKADEDYNYPILIRGAIRNYSDFHEKVYVPLLEGKPGEDAVFSADMRRFTQSRISYGENDFLIAAQTNADTFWKLMTYFLENSDSVDSTCWYIFTEFQHNYDDFDLKNSKQLAIPPDILKHEYEAFLDLYHENGREYPWMDALFELVSLHAQIDKYPVLHGPSYLIWGSLHIINQYLGGKVNDYSGNGDKDTLRPMLQRSRRGIERFVRQWDYLTDQITRVDDVIFHHLGGTSAIYSTLSESILELYHFFLSRFSAALLETDKVEATIASVYSFLLVPTSSQTMRISPMFHVKRTTERHKQVYIVEFPQEFMYKPSQFIFHLAHECLHIFGDAIRRRIPRTDAILSYLSFALVDQCFPEVRHRENLAGALYSELLDKVSGAIAGSSQNYSTPLPSRLDEILEYAWSDKGERAWKAEDFPQLDSHNSEAIYLKPIIVTLKDIVNRDILTPEMYAILCDTVEGDAGRDVHLYEDESSIYRDEAINRWVFMERQLSRWRYPRKKPKADESQELWQRDSVSFEEVIDACEYYFRECYADAMTIKLLNIRPNEYFSAFFPEADYVSGKSEAEAQLTQRISITLTACLEAGVFHEDEETIYDALKRGFTGFLSPVAVEIQRCVRVLRYCRNNGKIEYTLDDSERKWPPYPRDETDSSPNRHYDSVLTLLSVVDYLEEVLTFLDDVLKKKEHSVANESLRGIRDAYEEIIRKGNFFGGLYYQKIRSFHDAVGKKALNERIHA